MEVLSAWEFPGIGAIIRSRQSNRVDVIPILYEAAQNEARQNSAGCGLHSVRVQ